MGNKSKRQKRHRKRTDSRDKDKGLKFYSAPSPFSGLSRDDGMKILSELGANYADKYNDHLVNLQDAVLKYSPLQLLSMLAFYDLTWFGGKDPEVTKKDPILQHDVEFVQGLLLRNDLSEYKYDLSLHKDFDGLQTLIKDTARAYHMRRFQSINPDGQLSRQHTIERMRLHTQAVRNWAYPDMMMRIIKDLFHPLDDLIMSRFGVTCNDLVTFINNIVNQIEARARERYMLLRPIVQAKKIPILVRSYHEAFPDIESTEQDLFKVFHEKRVDINSAKAMLLSHADLSLSDLYTLHQKQLLELYPTEIDLGVLERLLDRWSLQFGALSETDPEHLFMGNPIWEKPFIRLGESEIFIPTVGLLISFCLELIEAVIRDDKEIWAKYLERRGMFLEEQLEEMFKMVFPEARVFRGCKWRNGIDNTLYETDIIVHIDSYLLVVEAKSGKVSDSARRGGDQRLGHVIKELLVSPAVQSQRFVQFLKDNLGTHTFKAHDNTECKIDNTKVTQYLRLSITMENLGFLSTRLPELKEAGFIANDVKIAPTMTLADLEIVFDMLEHPSQKLHYIRRRTDFEQNANYVGDEIDLLAFYMDNGFNVGEEEYNPEFMFHLSGLSKRFDEYYLFDDEKSRPRQRLTKWWSDIINRVEMWGEYQWTEVTHTLLNVEYEAQRQFEKNFSASQQRVTGSGLEASQFLVMRNGPEQRRDVLMSIAYKGVPKEERNRSVKSKASEVCEEHNVNRVLAIGVDVEHKTYPYNFLGFLQKGIGRDDD